MTQAEIIWDRVGPEPINAPDSAQPVLRQAMMASSALRSLLQAAAGANEPILICVNDPQRCTQTRPVLDLLAELAGDVVPRPTFEILVATGTHTFSDKARSVFEEVTFRCCKLSHVPVMWHTQDESSLAQLGRHRINKHVANRRFIISVGSVEPHYFAGVTGPHKTLAVGCMSRDDIERTHLGALSPASDLFRLQGNPVYDGLASIVKFLNTTGKQCVAIGQVAQGDHVVAADVGEPLDVTHALVPEARRIYARAVSSRVDLLHLRVPSPLGRSFYQADKALKNNHLAVRDGGAILLEADLEEGVGPASFFEFFKSAYSYADACRRVDESGYRLGDHKAVKLHYLLDADCRGVRLVIVSQGIASNELAGTPIQRVDTVEEGIDMCRAWLQDQPRLNGLVVEDAGAMCTTVADHNESSA